MSDEKLHTWFKAEETYARATAASWIGHPRVRQVLDEARPAAVAACGFLLRYMHDDQIQDNTILLADMPDRPPPTGRD